MYQSSEVVLMYGSGGWASKLENYTYRTSPFYKDFQDALKKEAWDDFQTGMDVAGVLDPTGLVDGINAGIYAARGQYANAVIAAISIAPYVGDLAKVGKYTKSTMKLGREVHATYKAAEEAAGLGVKEFRGIPGIRPDFVDQANKTIYELKPFNPRAMKAGEKQLIKYKAAFEAEYPGTIWKTVLDTY